MIPLTRRPGGLQAYKVIIEPGERQHEQQSHTPHNKSRPWPADRARARRKALPANVKPQVTALSWAAEPTPSAAEPAARLRVTPGSPHRDVDETAGS
jgi:hypothetical protein